MGRRQGAGLPAAVALMLIWVSVKDTSPPSIMDLLRCEHEEGTYVGSVEKQR